MDFIKCLRRAAWERISAVIFIGFMINLHEGYKQKPRQS